MVANTALIAGAEPVVKATTPLISVPVTDIADGLVPAPVDAAILGVEEFPFKCLAIASEDVVIAPVIVVLPEMLVLPPI